MSTQTISVISSTDIYSTLGIDKPEEMSRLFQIFGNDGSDTYDFCKALGWWSPVAQETYHSTEKERIVETFTSQDAEIAAAQQAIVLIAADIDAGGNYYPRVGDVVRYKNGVTGIISAISAAPVTITVDTTTATNLPAIGAGETITIISRTQGEASYLPTGAVTKVRRRDYQCQIIPERFVVTGTEMTNQKWVTELPGAGNTVMYYLEGQRDAEARSRLYAVGAWLYGEMNTTTITDTNSLTGSPYQTMAGLLPTIAADGINQTYPAGLLHINDFIAITRLLDKEGAKKDLLVWGGFDFMSQKDQVLMDYFKNYNVSEVIKGFQSNYFGGDAGLVGAIGFSACTINAFNLMFVKNQVFSHPKFGGAPGFTDSGTAIFVPMKGRSTGMADAPGVGWRYKQLGSYNRAYEIWKDGAAGGNPAGYIGQYDINSVSIRQHLGSHFIGVNQMCKLSQV